MKYFRMLNLRWVAIVITIIAFMLIGLASCTEGGSLEVTNGHTERAHVGVFYAQEMEARGKDIEPGEKAIWTFDKDEKIEYVWSFYDNPDVLLGPKSFFIASGDIERVTIKP
jgi:hypothetical protein